MFAASYSGVSTVTVTFDNVSTESCTLDEPKHNQQTKRPDLLVDKYNTLMFYL